MYEGESVNRSQIDIKCKTRDISTSTYLPSRLIHLSHRFTSALKPTAQKSFDCCLGYFCTWLSIICSFQTSLREFLEPVANRFMWQILPIGNISLWISFALSPFAHKKCIAEHCSLVVHPQAPSPYWLLKPASEHAHAHLLPRLSRSWTVLLPSDTHRKPITSITTVLLPFVPHLLTLPRNYWIIFWRSYEWHNWTGLGWKAVTTPVWHMLLWNKLINVATYGALNFTSKKPGLLKRMQDTIHITCSDQETFFACFIHKEVLCKTAVIWTMWQAQFQTC
jgi:hypothetical protein